MPELIAKANQAIFEAQWLREEQRSLRFEANLLASRLGETIVRARSAESGLRKTFLDVQQFAASGLLAPAVDEEDAAGSGQLSREV